MAGCKDCSVHVAPSTCHRCETGSVREAAIWDSSRHENHQLVQGLASEICALGEAERQLSESGTLSQKTYREVTRLLEEEERKRIESEKDNEPLKAEIDHKLFLTYISDRKGFLDSMYKSLIRIEDDRSDARFDHDSLPPEDDMDRILRYEERMHKQIDWAIQRLLESQERRTTLDYSPGTALPQPTKNEKRSQ